MTDAEPIKTEPTSVKFEKLSIESLESLDKPQLIKAVLASYEYIDTQGLSNSADTQSTKELDERCRQQLVEATKRETMLLKTLTEKEREISDLASQIDELKQYQLPSNNQLRSMLLDPTVNVVIMRLKKELENTRQRLEESQTELSAWKFTQDSQTGKQLMAKCRNLLKENEELGKQISQGRIAKLEGEIVLEKKLVDEMKDAQNENEKFIVELDDDMDGLQTTIYHLQDQLKEATERINQLELQNHSHGRTEAPDQAVNGGQHLETSNPTDNGVGELDQVGEDMDTAEKCSSEKAVTAMPNGFGEAIKT